MLEKHSVNKRMIQGATVILAMLISCGGIAVLAKNAAANGDDSATTDGSVLVAETASAADVSKDETVYVLANADGSVKKIIVSDWIKNSLNAAKLTDKTDVADVKNVKGDESYTMDTDNMKVWDAAGNDIYYQGTIDKELPVDLSVEYTLDGKTVAPADLAGKSGKVTMRFDYTNKQYETVDIDGVQTKIYVPFVMLTGMMLDNDNFRNVEVTNGKLINDGNHTIVAGFALPGMQENLSIDSDKLEIPDYVAVTADVTDFNIATTMTVATNSIFNDVDMSKVNSLDDLKAQMSTLTDAMKQLMDGSSTLYNGLSTLLGKSKELIAGINQVADASKQLSGGASKIADGAAAVDSGVADLTAGLAQLTANNAILGNGLTQLTDTFLSEAQTQLDANGITVDALTAANYSTVLNGLLQTPNDTQKQQLIAVANKTLDAQLAANGVPDAYYPAVKYMLYERLSGGMTQDAALAEIKTILTDASIADGVQKAEPDMGVLTALMQKGLPQETAGAISKCCVYLAAVNKTGTAADYVEQGSALAATLTVKAANAQILLTAAETAGTAQGTAVLNAFCLQLAEQTLTPSLTKVISALDLCTGLQTYVCAVQQISDTVSTKLAGGTAELKAGAATLADGASQLSDGAGQLQSQASALPEGVQKLTDGSMQLSDGLKKLNEEGISKLTNLVNGDVNTLITRLKATMDVSKDYKSFGGICDGENGSVKFIYKTDSIEK